MNFALVETVDADNPVEGDLRLTANQITFVEGVDAIAQHLRNRLRFFLGEWFLDQRQGFPYFRDVFIKNPNRPAILSLLRRTIRETPGIVSVDELTLSISPARVATVDFKAALDGTDEPLVFTDFVIGDFGVGAEREGAT